MKKSLAAAGMIFLLMSGCSEESDRSSGKHPSSMGQYHEPYLPVFATVVNGGTSRQATGNFFVRHGQFVSDEAIEVMPGDTFTPDLPVLIPDGYEMRIVLEEVNRSAEKPKEIEQFTADLAEETTVKLPQTEGKLYRYTIKVYDAAGEFKDVNYYPLFTSFPDYHAGVALIKDEVKQGEPLHLVIHNWGPNHLAVDEEYRLFERNGDDLEEVRIEPYNGPVAAGPAYMETPWSMKELRMGQELDSLLLSVDTTETLLVDGYTEEKGDFLLQVEVGSNDNRHSLYAAFSVDE
ncbi:hypothetical protein [Domibacillus iocasae]|uniref:Uncharacterized protein n=1 Tax=Domibacillus iocasae TaxID=1714016 RepID=A0A1E7DPF9_9BACI|nr:hypothetical protein [Domibacillus iocasae]OES44929.1 hypothetical protein BA724_06610 [Domibacillus iocasae]